MAVSSARKDNYEKDSSKTVINSELLIFFIVFSCCLVRLARSALSSISMYPCSIREQAIALIQVFLSLPLRRLSPNNFLNLSKSVALCILSNQGCSNATITMQSHDARVSAARKKNYANLLASRKILMFPTTYLECLVHRKKCYFSSLFQINFIFPLFFGMVIYSNE